MHALRRVHEALRPGGILLDLMPFDQWALVENAAGLVGRIDQREFARDVRKTEARLASVEALVKELRHVTP